MTIYIDIWYIAVFVAIKPKKNIKNYVELNVLRRFQRVCVHLLFLPRIHVAIVHYVALINILTRGQLKFSLLRFS